MNKLLITGAAGFIGSNFVRYWFEEYPKDNIIALDALTYAGNKSNLKDQIEFICPENKDALFGNQKFWNEMQAIAPKELGKIVGDYLIGQPIPTLPE